MFTAIVLACIMTAPDTCVEAVDTRGPYPTEEQCVMRAYQMMTELQVLFPVPHKYEYKCVPKGTEI